MRTVLKLNYGRTFPCSEPNVGQIRMIEIDSFRVVWNHLEITVGDTKHYLNSKDGLVYYDGVWYSDVQIETVHESVVIEQYNPCLSTQKRASLPIEHPRLAEAISILKDEIEVDGETMQYILEEVGVDEFNGVQHRMSMILDDLKVIQDQLSAESLKSRTKFAETLGTHFSNIEIACDLDSDESLGWKTFGRNRDNN